VGNQTQGNGRSKNRSRNVIWFNPPYSQNVQTNVAKLFLHLIDKHFPKSHKLHRILNRNNLKISYSCTASIANMIKNHSQKVLNDNSEVTNRKKMQLQKLKPFALSTDNVSLHPQPPKSYPLLCGARRPG